MQLYLRKKLAPPHHHRHLLKAVASDLNDYSIGCLLCSEQQTCESFSPFSLYYPASFLSSSQEPT